jgi:PhnB protein
MAAKKKSAKKSSKKPAAKKSAKKASKKVNPIPPQYHTVTPFLTSHDANAQIDWYKKAFGAKELSRMPGPGGKLMHSEVRIGDSVVMIADEMQGMSKSAKTLGDSPVGLMIYTKDVDSFFGKATAAGATTVMPVADQFWGDRYGQLQDPFGFKWSIGTHIKDMTPKQMQAAQDEWMKQMAAQGAAPSNAAE